MKGSVNVLGRHGKNEMLVTCTQEMKPLLTGNVYNLYRV
jgi:hypothetical protein